MLSFKFIKNPDWGSPEDLAVAKKHIVTQPHLKSGY